MTVKAEKTISINRRNLGHTMFPSNDLMSRNAQDIGELFNRKNQFINTKSSTGIGVSTYSVNLGKKYKKL